MKKFFQSSQKELSEMAAPKMPAGTKRKRSDTYAHTHDIHIGGQHVATITGMQANRRAYGRGNAPPAHAKIYQIHTNQEQILKGGFHPDHSFPAKETHFSYDAKGNHVSELRDVRKPIEHHSMEDAVHAVINTHKNNEVFGHGHDPKTRWAHAIKLASGHDDHEQKTAQYKTALSHARSLGHDDVTNALQAHHDAHVAKGSKPSEDKLKQWTHDAYRFTGTTHHYAKYSSDRVKEKEAYDAPNHPEHYDLAKQAHNVHVHGHPGGSKWDRERGHKGY
jgi:hypothetical protein